MRFAASVLILSLAGQLVLAHHGAGTFDRDSSVEYTGTVTGVDFVNPHAWVYFDVTAPDGNVAAHRCEMRAATVLRRSGWSAEMFVPGERVRISGRGDRYDPNSCYLTTIVFQDGTRADRYGQFDKVEPLVGPVRPLRLPSGAPNISGDWAPEQLVMTDPRGRGGALVPLSAVDQYEPGEGRIGDPTRAGDGGARQYRTRGADLTPLGEQAAAEFQTYSPEYNPRMRCETTSILFDWTFDGPVNRITQNADTITLEYGQFGFTRTIHMSLEAHPADVEPSRAGHSIGRWEGDVLIVDTVGFAPGVLSPPIRNSEQLHVVERFSLDPATLALTRSYVAEDPIYFTGQYVGEDTIHVADVPFGPDPCSELTFVDYGEFTAVTDEMLQQPADGDWLMWRRTLSGWGYSPLDQIDRRNVAELEPVWSHPLGTGIQEATPLVYGGRMFVPNNGDYIQAFDARSGELQWEYKRAYPEGVNGGTNRTIAIWDTLIINASSDNQMYALDARTGTLVWETKVLEPTLRARASSGPIIANGKVITGRQCQPDATHESCIVTAHDAATGRELWRTRTIPRPGEPGDETWGDVPLAERWHVGTWMVPSYDPELDTIYIGTSVTIPAPKFTLGGNDLEHLYHNSTLALDADTGRIKWHYQHVVDHWDLDHPFERLLVDTAVAPDASEVPWINPRVRAGETRKVITGIPGKTGLVYTLDRETGEFLWARPTIEQNVISSIDGATGRAQVNPDLLFTAGGQTLTVCPGASGGKNWPAGAYSPRTNAMYMPMQNLCMVATTQSGERDPSLVYGFRTEGVLAEGTDDVGAIWAVSAETGKALWKHEQRAGVMSLVATGGGLVFGGDVAGKLKAYDEASGAVLWEADLGAPVSGYPVSFAVDGKQYVAVTTGPSLVAASTRRMAPELPPAEAPAAVHVFALP